MNDKIKKIYDDNKHEIASWYISDKADVPKSFLVDFKTLEPLKCRAILDGILQEIRKGAE